MGKLNLSEAAKEILSASVASKRGGQDAPKKLSPSVAYGTKDAGYIGVDPDDADDLLPNYTKGTPTATPPGATPPVGKQPDGVGATKPAGQPQETMGRGELRDVKQDDATEYADKRDRKPAKLAPQTFEKNPGATFQSYGEGLDLSDDVNALLEGESLSEEFKQKATTIFEAAVTARVTAIAEEIENQLVEQFESAVETIKEELTGKVDDYLNYMVEEWMQENELAVESGIRTEIAEDFMGKLRNLFVESYIDIPQEQVNVVEELAAKVEKLENDLNEQIEKNMQFKSEINEHKKIEAIHAVCEGLIQTQVEKIKSLAESIEFTTEEEFASKLETIKESYFPETIKKSTQSDLNESVEFEDEPVATKKVETDPLMTAYAQAITKTTVK